MEQRVNTAGAITINRNLYTLDDYYKQYEQRTTKRTPKEYFKEKCTPKRIVKVLVSYLPVLKVFRKYKLRDNLASDILAGLTVSFIHLPQGLAFGLLASLQPIYGLYTTFFPVLFYMIFGTSPYISYGPTANMAILTRTVVEREAQLFIDQYVFSGNVSLNNLSIIGPSEAEILQIKVGSAAACSLISGLSLSIIGFFRLGFLTSYLSTSFIGGFTTAAALFVASSQVEKLFGLKTETYSGAGGLVLSYIDLFRKLGGSKAPEIVISVICISVLLAVKIGINERYKDKLKIPIPIDFIVAVIATVVSYLTKLEDKFDVIIVGPIPSGFASPTLPKLDNVSDYITDSIVIAVVSLAMSITFAKLTAKKHGNTIDESQELFAYGASNILAAFFGCFPAANASPRTGILSSLGAKTTLNGLATISVFLLIILVVGQLFVYLPTAVLASMIIISTKDLVLQYRNLPKIWKINKFDFIIWIVTNLSSLLLDLYYGLIIGLFVSILLVVVQSQSGTGYVLKKSENEDIFHRIDNGMKNVCNDQVIIFKFPMSIYYATAERFKTQIYKKVFNPDVYRKRQKRLNKTMRIEANGATNEAYANGGGHSFGLNINSTKIEGEDFYKPEYIIIDCSMVSYIDMAGANMLQEVITGYSNVDITLFLTGLTEKPFRVLDSYGLFDNFSKTNVFVDVFDALEASKRPVSFVSHLYENEFGCKQTAATSIVKVDLKVVTKSAAAVSATFNTTTKESV